VRHVLLVESLDAPGARHEHAEARARALEVAGVEVHVEVAAADETATLRARVAEACRDFAPDAAVVAAAPGRGAAIARSALGTTPCLLWPTSLPGRPVGGDPRELHGDDGAEESVYHGALGFHPAGADALDWAVHDSEAHRPRLPLWDARYLVAPAPLRGPGARVLLESFAALDARWDQLDLVVLDDAAPELQKLARRLGVAPRVHFAGAATHDAEWTWLRASAGVVLAAPDRLRADLLIASLAAGTPVLGFGSGAARIAMGWLADRGGVPASWASAMIPSRSKLEHLLERDAAVESALTRGIAVARMHDVEATGRRLAAALGLEEQRRAA
jgi:hypothetical protein